VSEISSDSPGFHDLEGGRCELRLVTDDAIVVILPDKGSDIFELVDRRSGIDVLGKAPWGLRPAGSIPQSRSSVERWLHHCGGGWQLLLPDGGKDAIVAGVSVGFHGEARLIPRWIVETSDATARLEVELHQVPLAIDRCIALAGARLTVEETVQNLGDDPIEFMWSHPPGFGAPFIGPGVQIETGARTFITDPDITGSLLPAGHTVGWPVVVDGDIRHDLSKVPAAPQHHFGYLCNFDRPFYRITNGALGLALEAEWDSTDHRYAWFWQGFDLSPGFSWHRRAYVMAIEPASTIPGHGFEHAVAEGRHVVALEAGESRIFTISAELRSER